MNSLPCLMEEIKKRQEDLVLLVKAKTSLRQVVPASHLICVALELEIAAHHEVVRKLRRDLILFVEDKIDDGTKEMEVENG